jgi:hypothetical protein
MGDTANGQTKNRTARALSGAGVPNGWPNTPMLEWTGRHTPLCVRAEDLYLSPCAPPHCGQYRHGAGAGAAPIVVARGRVAAAIIGRPSFQRLPAALDVRRPTTTPGLYLNAIRVAVYNESLRITHQREKQMKNFILFLAIVCGGVTVMFYTAAKEAVDGPNWASKVCSAGRSLSLCQDPRQLAFVAAGLGALWLVMMFVSAIRD